MIHKTELVVKSLPIKIEGSSFRQMRANNRGYCRRDNGFVTFIRSY